MERERPLIELRPLQTDRSQINETSQSLPPPSSELVSSPTSLYSMPSGIEYVTCPCLGEPNDFTIQNKKCGMECKRLHVLKHPDSVIWYDRPEKVVLHKKKSYGFRVKEVQSANSHYTLVHVVYQEGAAEGKLYMGDHLLSANQVPLQNESALKEVLSESTENSVTLIKCRPIGLRLTNHRGLSPTIQHPLSHPNRGPFDAIVSDSQSDSQSSSSGSNSLTRTGSKNSKSSSGSSSCMQCSNPSTPDVNVNINLYQDIKTAEGACGPSDVSRVELNPQECAALDMRLSQILSSNMPRLPQLKLFILGMRSTTIAECLASKCRVVSSDDICTKYKSSVIKTDRGYEWEPVSPQKHGLYSITKKLTASCDCNPSIDLRKSRLPSKDIPQCSDLLRDLHKRICEGHQDQTNFEEVDLEIIAMNETPITDYCGHILYTAHGVYIVQFNCEDYFAYQKYVLTYIQTQLTKICTYASDRVQVFLVASAKNPLPSHEMENIGQNLKEHFSSAFCNQLHYNPVTDLPCHFVFQQNHLNDLSHRARFNRLTSREDNTSPRNTADLFDASETPSVNDQDANVFDTEDLKRQISSLVFHQGFVTKPYPYQYLVYQEKKNKFCETHQPVGAQKSQIFSECAVDDPTEQDVLLKYLHDTGDIICMDYQPYNMISQHLTSRLPLMVILNRDQLIDAAKKLLTIPNPSDQDASHRTEWNDLQNDKIITQPFLKHLLGTDAVVLGIFLDAMNVIYCMNDGLSQLQGDRTPVKYLAPFFFPDEQIQHRHLSPLPYKDRVLYLDFNGFVPHGTFMRLLVQLIGESVETSGAWKIDSKGSCQLGCADDFELQINLDPSAALIKIEAEWKIPYHAPNIPAILHERMRQLQAGNKTISYKLGPQCPHSPQCQVGNKIHVLDISHDQGILWCGHQQVDQVPSVKQWLPEKRRVNQPIEYRSSRPVVVQKSAHMKQWPPSLYKWVCDHLNVPQHSGHDWKMLAEKLGYNMEDILIFKARRSSQEDPCDSLLQEWGRSAKATVGNLLELLEQMGRSDLVIDLKSDRQEKWHII